MLHEDIGQNDFGLLFESSFEYRVATRQFEDVVPQFLKHDSQYFSEGVIVINENNTGHGLYPEILVC